MGGEAVFRRKQTFPLPAFDRELWEPVIRCSICTGEQTAGLLEKATGRFRELQVLRSPRELQDFAEACGSDRPPRKIY